MFESVRDWFLKSSAEFAVTPNPTIKPMVEFKRADLKIEIPILDEEPPIIISEEEIPKQDVYVLFGSTGMLGSHWARFLMMRNYDNLIVCNRQEFEIELKTLSYLYVQDTVVRKLTQWTKTRQTEPNRVFLLNCIGSRASKVSSEEETETINIDFPLYLKSLVKKNPKWYYVHFSPAFVFCGLKAPNETQFYKEGDLPCLQISFDDFEKSSKRKAEQMLRGQTRVLIFRVLCIGYEPVKNKYVADWLLSDYERFRVGFPNLFLNPVSCSTLCTLVYDILSHKEPPGSHIFHLFCKNWCSHAEILDLVVPLYEGRPIHLVRLTQTKDIRLDSGISEWREKCRAMGPLSEQLKQLKHFWTASKHK